MSAGVNIRHLFGGSLSTRILLAALACVFFQPIGTAGAEVTLCSANEFMEASLINITALADQFSGRTVTIAARECTIQNITITGSNARNGACVFTPVIQLLDVKFTSLQILDVALTGGSSYVLVDGGSAAWATGQVSEDLVAEVSLVANVSLADGAQLRFRHSRLSVRFEGRLHVIDHAAVSLVNCILRSSSASTAGIDINTADVLLEDGAALAIANCNITGVDHSIRIFQSNVSVRHGGKATVRNCSLLSGDIGVGFTASRMRLEEGSTFAIEGCQMTGKYCNFITRNGAQLTITGGSLFTLANTTHPTKASYVIVFASGTAIRIADQSQLLLQSIRSFQGHVLFQGCTIVDVNNQSSIVMEDISLTYNGDRIGFETKSPTIVTTGSMVVIRRFRASQIVVAVLNVTDNSLLLVADGATKSVDFVDPVCVGFQSDLTILRVASSGLSTPQNQPVNLFHNTARLTVKNSTFTPPIPSWTLYISTASDGRLHLLDNAFFVTQNEITGTLVWPLGPGSGKVLVRCTRLRGAFQEASVFGFGSTPARLDETSAGSCGTCTSPVDCFLTAAADPLPAASQACPPSCACAARSQTQATFPSAVDLDASCYPATTRATPLPFFAADPPRDGIDATTPSRTLIARTETATPTAHRHHSRSVTTLGTRSRSAPSPAALGRSATLTVVAQIVDAAPAKDRTRTSTTGLNANTVTPTVVQLERPETPPRDRPTLLGDPVPVAVQGAATGAVVAAALVTSGVSPSAASRVPAFRAALRAVDCAFSVDDVEDPSPADHPLQGLWTMEDGSNRLAGAVVLELLLVLLMWGGQVAVFASACDYYAPVARAQPPTTSVLAFLKHWGAFTLVIYAYLQPSILSGSITVARHTDVPAVGAVAAAIACALIPLLWVGVLHVGFRKYTRVAQATDALTTNGGGADVATDISGQVPFMRAFGITFEACRGHDRIITRSGVMADIAAASLVAAAAGWSPAEGESCLSVGAVMVLAALLHLLYLGAVRPFRDRIDITFAVVAATSTALVACVGTLAAANIVAIATAVDVAEIATYIQTGAFFLQPLVAVASLAWQRFRHHSGSTEATKCLGSDEGLLAVPVTIAVDEQKVHMPDGGLRRNPLLPGS